MNKKLFLPLIAFFILVALFGWQLLRNAHGDDPKALESALVGKALPHFDLPALAPDQGRVATQSLPSHTPFLLNVWATWCPTCYAEHSYLNTLKSAVTMVGINYKDNRNAALRWLENLGNPYQQVIFDEKGALGFDLGVYGAPETFLIDCAGIIRYRFAGALDNRVWENTLKPLYERYAKEAICQK
ncbi:DsbE family thiol:disulfide interchange protein [Pasteurellaceae bacterium HPA106]|uniref:DsbE family thiol:disulfide interchange protein n=1 Tax=Spirabiliibacterium pneumoniae TaxID=221400 RepID=UPI001AAD6FF9|nr:DsbE family thiol:disulfide interchange protein [Spirabiliibacterium pneumoniae]MBE2897193.1 DsbE family thiol:disulfide interchange protein [Spirabiliibacterium pneumoniae]